MTGPIVNVDVQFSGSGELCTAPYVTPPPPPPGCPVAVIPGPPPDVPPFSGEGTLGALIGPYTIQTFEVTGHFYAVADPSISGTINNPIMQPVNALVSFTPRLPMGYQFFVDDYLITNAYNAEQTISMIGNPVQGTWQLQSPLAATDITGQLPYNETPAGLQAALAALPSIGAGNVTVVAGVNPQSYDVQFTGNLGAAEVLPLVVYSTTDLVDANGYDTTVTVAVTQTGSPQITASTSVSVPPRQARIMAGVLSTIDYVDTPGVQLVSNSPILALPAPYYPLIYDVAFSAVTFNDASQILGNFAFVAPTDGTAVDLTSRSLEKLAYQKPITYIWGPEVEEPYETPNAAVVASMSGWRARAAQEKVRIA
jgi:hypothetical protein